jgi:flagellar biosynthesis anti-sigma factor FlgM
MLAKHILRAKAAKALAETVDVWWVSGRREGLLGRLKLFNMLPIVELQGEIAGEEVAMRIDLNTSIGQTSNPAEATKSNLRSSSGPADSEVPADVTKLSPDYARVQALTAAVSELPEIRQDKVAALAEMIRSGNYAVNAEQTAEALVSHMAGAAA